MSRKSLSLVIIVMFSLLFSHRWAEAQRGSLPARSLNTAVPQGPGIELSWFEDDQHLPAAAYHPGFNEFLTVWHSNGGNGNDRIFGTRLSAAGEILGQFVLAGDHDRVQPSVAYDPVSQRYLVVWSEDVSDSGTNWDVYGAFITVTIANPFFGAPFAINEFSTNQGSPQVVYASDTSEFFVIWTNTYAAGTPKAYLSGRRVKSDGTFPSAGVNLTISNPSKNLIHPDIVYNENLAQFLVVWEEVATERDIHGQLIASSGSLVGSAFGIAGWPGFEEYPSAAICPGTGQYLVAWQALQPTGHYDIYGRLVSAAGTPGTVGKIYGIAGANETRPSAACSPASQSPLVIWEEQYSSTSGPYGIWGRQVGDNLSLGPTFPLVIPVQGTVTGYRRPFLAAGGTGFLAVWEHEIGTNPGQAIYGRLLANETVFLPAVTR